MSLTTTRPHLCKFLLSISYSTSEYNSFVKNLRSGSSRNSNSCKHITTNIAPESRRITAHKHNNSIQVEGTSSSSNQQYGNINIRVDKTKKPKLEYKLLKKSARGKIRRVVDIGAYLDH